MQGPTGSSGVHLTPNRGQNSGESLPVITSPQRQAVATGEGLCAIQNLFSASNSEKSALKPRPLPSMLPSPRQISVRGSKQRSIILRARLLPHSETARVYSFSSFASPALICFIIMETERIISSPSKPEITAASAWRPWWSSGQFAEIKEDIWLFMIRGC